MKKKICYNCEYCVQGYGLNDNNKRVWSCGNCWFELEEIKKGWCWAKTFNNGNEACDKFKEIGLFEKVKRYFKAKIDNIEV